MLLVITKDRIFVQVIPLITLAIKMIKCAKSYKNEVLILSISNFIFNNIIIYKLA